jgi:hypothetical protein
VIDKWKQIPLKVRLLILFFAGFLLIIWQLYSFNMFVLAAGMALLLICFFSLQEAPAELYEPRHKFKLFIAPVIVAICGAIAGLVMYGGVFMAISASIVAVSIFTMFIGEILLSFGEPRVYRGFYAYVAGGVFFVIGLFIIVTFLSTREDHIADNDPAAWDGTYRFRETGRSGCEMFDIIAIHSGDNPGDLQYTASISSEVQCSSDTVAAIPLYDEISALAVEKGDSLIIWRYNGGVSDTLCVLYRVGEEVNILRHSESFDEGK